MNKENLLKMADHIETVPEELFNMSYFRSGNVKTSECNSSGCIIGHSVVLDDWENVPLTTLDEINFSKWSEEFTGLHLISNEWNYLFDVKWGWNENEGPKQAAARIRYFVENGLPVDWDLQQGGDAELPYLKKPYYNE